MQASPLTKRSGTIACIGTGPSLTPQQIQSARHKGFVLFGCNNVWEIVPDLALLYGCNYQWWKSRWSAELARHPAEKWTTNVEAAEEFGLNWIAERNAKGLSADLSVIHHGHGSGYTLVNLALLAGAERIVLLGYDLRYAPDYDGGSQMIGSSPRHYFGEYGPELQHWPKVKVKNGIHVELLELYTSVAEQGLVEIVNCTGPNSALTCFPMKNIDAL